MAVSKIKQHDLTDCGAACLAAIAAHYRQKWPIARIRHMAGTDKWGTNLLGLIKAAQKMGFDARGVRVAPEELRALPGPAIAHVVVKEGWHHFVVLTRVGKKHIQFMDPALGRIRKLSHQQWQQISTGIYLLLSPGTHFSRIDRAPSVWQRFRTLIYPHRRVFWQALFGASVYTLLGLSTSIYLQKITDFVLVDGNRNLLNLLSVAMLFLILIQGLIGISRNLLVLKTGHLIDAELIMGYYRHLLQLPQSFFDRMRVGEIISRVGDAVKIRAFINDISINLLVNVQIILCAFALMFTYYWKLALVLAGILPLYATIYWISDRLNRSKERKVMEKAADLESQLVESLSSIRTIKQLGLEAHARRQNESRLLQLLEQSYGAALNGIFAGVSTELVNRVFTVLLLWVGARFVLQQALSPGELLSFYALIAYFTGPASSLIGMNKAWQSARIAADRLFEIFDLEVEETAQAAQLDRSEVGDIRMQEVRFSYTNRAEVLRGVSLCIPKGKMTAIVGQSGSGKSSIAALLQKLYPLSSGTIYLGDYNLQQISRQCLRKLVGIVPQKIDLFAGTIIENMAPGESEPDVKRIVDLCTRLGLQSFIEQLPQHYQSQIGENGVNLSGGQAQRLALVRALYRDPEILILDEATSALDPDTEALVQQFMQELLAAGKTLVLIAHRLSSVVRADQILVLEQGQVREAGHHRELIERRGRYYELWQKQLPNDWQDILPATGS